MLQRFKKQNKGFTLIEMLVSIALFSIVLTISIGVIFTVIDTNRKSQTLTLVMNNLNFTIESMTRSIKTAEPNSFNETSNNLRLENNGKIIVYSFSEDAIYKSVGGNTATPITSPDIVVESAIFDLIPTTNGQPRVFIYVKGYAEITADVRSDFSIQTTVSPRKLNI